MKRGWNLQVMYWFVERDIYIYMHCMMCYYRMRGDGICILKNIYVYTSLLIYLNVFKIYTYIIHLFIQLLMHLLCFFSEILCMNLFAIFLCVYVPIHLCTQFVFYIHWNIVASICLIIGLFIWLMMDGWNGEDGEIFIGWEGMDAWMDGWMEG